MSFKMMVKGTASMCICSVQYMNLCILRIRELSSNLKVAQPILRLFNTFAQFTNVADQQDESV